MKLPCHLCFATIIAVCAAAVSWPVGAADAPALTTPQEGLLILANGSVIEGVIAREGDYYRVLLPKGKLQVRADQVDFLCLSKEEAYVRRRARMIGTTSTIEAHLEMARWCIQQGLFACATEELHEARSLNPQHRSLTVVETQLTQAQQHAQRIPVSAPTKDKHLVAASAISEQHNSLAAEVPPWARSEFIKRVQPMLANSCATSGCHVPSSSQELRIDRTALDGVGNPELFQRNLGEVLAMVNSADPDSSRLLAMGAAIHGSPGGVQSRPLTSHQLEILRAWVSQLALAEPPQEEEKPRVAQIVIGLNSSAQQKHVPPVQTPQAAPDPFDPAAFNQEHASSLKSTASPTETVPPTPPAE
jgi:hypothetical protein